MTYRARLTLALVALALLPVGILGYGVRREMATRLDVSAEGRIEDAEAATVDAVLAAAATERERIAGVAASLSREERFRAAVTESRPADRRWLADWGPSTLVSSGLAMLELHDSSAQILSSGHSGESAGRTQGAVATALSTSPVAVAVVQAGDAGDPRRALVTSAPVNVRGAVFHLFGGSSLDSARVAGFSPEPTVSSVLLVGDQAMPEGGFAVMTLPFVDLRDAARPDSARIVLVADTGPAAALRDGVTRWILVALGLTIAAALAIAGILGRVISAPIVGLSERTARLDLDRLEERFASGRDDELGALERTLDALTARLRTSVSRLKEAERAAATGDLARQVNHDIKNGLAPIRNVLRHLGQVAKESPATLAATFDERRETLDSSVEYLDKLARNYAKLSPALERGATDPVPVLRSIAAGLGDAGGATVGLNIVDGLWPVRADAVALQRVVENLVSNAVDALEGEPGTVTIAATNVDERGRRRVRIAVADTGRGMTRAEFDRAFDDFHTTKPDGTGLGLSVVRRLLGDLGGSISAETSPGKGSTFTVEFPAA